MFSLLRRIKSRSAAAISQIPAPENPTGDFLLPMSTTDLLATSRRQMLLKNIWQRTAVSRAQFDCLYLGPIERYSALVQRFPASESHHHAYEGGMLDHGLEIMAYALKLRQSHLLPIGSSPETQTAQAEAWTAATAYAALLHDIGKIAVDIDVETADSKVWHPWHGPLSSPYRFRYRPGREYRLHSAAAGLLYTAILERDVLDWLSTFPALWSAFLYVLAGQMEHAGILGELVTKADQASVAQEMGGDPQKALMAPKQSLQRKLLDGLRYLIKDKLKLNQPDASDGWLTDDGLWLVSKTVSDKLRAHLLSQGISGIPQSNNGVFDVLQEHAIAQPTADGKIIWKVAITSKSGWSSSLTVFKVSPALIWETGERPDPFEGSVVAVTADTSTDEPATADGLSAKPDQAKQTASPVPAIPSVKADSLDAVLDLLGPSIVPEAAVDISIPDNSARTENMKLSPPETIQPLKKTKTVSGSDEDIEPSVDHFLVWLKEAILSKKLIINDAQALVHTVADSVFLVSPSLFIRYTQEFPQCGKLARAEEMMDWQWAQKQFEKLKVHKKQPNGMNIWTCEVKGPRKTRRVHGYLLDKPELIMPEIPFNNPFLALTTASQN